VSGVELLMNNHQSLKAEVDAREENFTICINLGKDLLDRKHYRSDEVCILLKMLNSCFFFTKLMLKLPSYHKLLSS
jgi:spectrin beta